jgi:hypothetical protein
MDTLSRRLRYARQRYGTGFTSEQLMFMIRDGTENTLLTPGQRRRVRHKRGGAGAHRQAQRTRRTEAAARREEARSVLYEGAKDAPAGIPNENFEEAAARNPRVTALRMQIEGLRRRQSRRGT